MLEKSKNFSPWADFLNRNTSVLAYEVLMKRMVRERATIRDAFMLTSDNRLMILITDLTHITHNIHVI